MAFSNPRRKGSYCSIILCSPYPYLFPVVEPYSFIGGATLDVIVAFLVVLDVAYVG